MAQRLTRYLLVCLYLAAGVLHLLLPRPFIAITPSWVPQAALVIALTGVAELAGAIGLAQPWYPRLRQAAGWGLAAYALCVWPANVNHMLIDLARADHGLGWAYHGPRMLMQPVLIWAALWCSGALQPRAG
ncbi:DoxX family protein [Novosphingobium sp.]|uniref:DoxX family protein n=1 Tax=Novosphingobium sp. TaxID=1874826 RepID=UPI00333EF001